MLIIARIARAELPEPPYFSEYVRRGTILCWTSERSQAREFACAEDAQELMWKLGKGAVLRAT